jgi:hypothetical protein
VMETRPEEFRRSFFDGSRCNDCGDIHADCICGEAVDLCPVCGVSNDACACWLCSDCMTTNPHTRENCRTCGGVSHACPEVENACSSEVCRCAFIVGAG